MTRKKTIKRIKKETKSPKKKTSKRKSYKQASLNDFHQELTKHAELDNQRFLDLKERFDKMNGAIPLIKESMKNVEQVVIRRDGKIDNLHNYNMKQDSEINEIKVSVAKNSKISSWVEKVFIFTGAGALITGMVYAFLNIVLK